MGLAISYKTLSPISSFVFPNQEAGGQTHVKGFRMEGKDLTHQSWWGCRLLPDQGLSL